MSVIFKLPPDVYPEVSKFLCNIDCAALKTSHRVFINIEMKVSVFILNTEMLSAKIEKVQRKHKNLERFWASYNEVLDDRCRYNPRTRTVFAPFIPNVITLRSKELVRLKDKHSQNLAILKLSGTVYPYPK